MMALARRIVNGEADEADDETMVEAFAAARDAEATAEELLVDDGWKAVESLPRGWTRGGRPSRSTACPVLDTGATGRTAIIPTALGRRSSWRRSTGTRPPTAMATGTASRPYLVSGANGHHSLPRTGYGDEEPEPQQSLFSWAEFMAEPVKPKRKNGKPQPATLSMFEVGDGAGARGRAGRRRTLDPPHTGRTPTAGVLPRFVREARTVSRRGRRRHGNGSGDDRHRKGERPVARIFVYDDREFPDPDPEMSVDQVKSTLSDFYGEIANASVKEAKRGEDTVYEFQRRVGTKGAAARS